MNSEDKMITRDMVIDLAWLEAATLEDLKTVLTISRTDPRMLAEVNALLLSPEGSVISMEMLNDPDYKPKSQRTPSPEETAQIAADTALAEQQAAAAKAEADAVAAALVPPVVESVAPVAPVVPNFQEEDAEALKAGITITRNDQGRVTKIVKTYQAVNEDGRPIGRPTHLEAKSWIELSSKETAAHENAVRYAERVKKNKIQSVQSTAQQRQTEDQIQKVEAEATAAVEVASKEKDPVKLHDAIRKVNKADREAEIARQTARAAGVAESTAWMADHKEDFHPCEANSNIIGAWLKENNLGLSYDNLELAFAANETRLAKPPVETPVVEVPAAPVVNPPAAAPVAPVAQAAPIVPLVAPVVAAPVSTAASVEPSSQPTPPAPVSTPAAAAQSATPARRPGVNASLQPGTLTAERPVTLAPSQTTTRAELLKAIDKMSPQEYRNKVKTSKQFRDQLEAAGISVAGKAQYGY